MSIRSCMQHSVLLIVALLACVNPLGAVPVITVAPGSSPAGYIPLSTFGVGAIAAPNDGIFNFNVGNFLYAGEQWNTVGMASNGFVVVGGGGPGDGAAGNQSLPDSSGPNNILAPYWTDFDLAVGGALRIAVLTDGVSDWAVMDWANVVEAAPGGTIVSFQVWIGLNAVEDITFTYNQAQALGTGGGNLTIGAEDKTGTIGTNYFYNGVGTLPTDDLRVTTRDLPVAVPEPNALLLVAAACLALVTARKTVRRC